jgi:hypothetical protein
MSPVIEGVTAPTPYAGVPGAGTDEVQNLAVGATPTGGTFKLAFQGRVSPAITWSATTNTMLANIEAALNGTGAVQTITFAGTLSGKFRLRYRGQETATITWSATNNTLRDNVDAALEALPNIGAGEVTTAVGTMTSGVGTLTVTFAGTLLGPQPILEVTDNRTGGTISVATTTAGVEGPMGPDGIAATDVDMVAGTGNIAITFDGTAHAKKAQPLITVAQNALTGTGATLAVTETTPGVDATFRGASKGALVQDVTNGVAYINEGVAGAPTWTKIGTQS